MAKAIAAFERTIVSRDNRFDQWIASDSSAITTAEAEGFSIFLDKGNCVICHRGFNFTVPQGYLWVNPPVLSRRTP